MKIYFSGSIRGGRQDAVLYRQLIDELKTYGKVLTEHIGNENVWHEKTDSEIYDEDMNWLNESDIVIAEVTTPSLGVGYEIGQAVALGKRVICIYRPVKNKSISAMIKGSPGVICYPYRDVEEALQIFSEVFQLLS